MFLEIGHIGPFYKSGELMAKCKKWPSGKSGQVQLWLTLFVKWPSELMAKCNEWPSEYSAKGIK